MDIDSKPDPIVFSGGQIAKFEKKIGEGAFASIWKGTYNGADCALKIKIADRSKQKYINQVKQEAEMIARLHEHPNIIKAFDISLDHLCIVISLGSCDLSTFVSEQFSKEDGGLNIKTIRIIARQIASACAHIHACGMMHCDVKSSNVLVMNRDRVISQGETPFIMLADLGSAVIGQTAPSEHGGTYEYMATELYFGNPYTPSCDVFAFGTLLFTMYTDAHIFDVRCDEEARNIFPPAFNQFFYGDDGLCDEFDSNINLDINEEIVDAGKESSEEFEDDREITYNAILLHTCFLGLPPKKLWQDMSYYLNPIELKKGNFVPKYTAAHGPIPQISIEKMLDDLIEPEKPNTNKEMASFLNLCLRYENRLNFNQLLCTDFLSI